MIKEGLIIAILFLAIPIGFLLNKLCWDELKAGRKWFKLIIAGAITAMLMLLAVDAGANAAAILALVFLTIIAFIGLGKRVKKRK